MTKLKNIFIFIFVGLISFVLLTFGSGLWLGLYLALRGFFVLLLIGIGFFLGWAGRGIFKK